MSLACELAPNVLNAATVALFLCGIEIPVEKADLKKSAKKTDTTSSASLYNGVLWEEYAPGPSGGTFNFDTKWRASGAITPPSVRQGAIYPVSMYVRRPQTVNATDPGSAYTFNFYVEENTLSFDPKNGVIEWKCSGCATGPIIEPT